MSHLFKIFLVGFKLFFILFQAKQDQLEADGLFNPSFFGNQERSLLKIVLHIYVLCKFYVHFFVGSPLLQSRSRVFGA